MNKKMLGFAVVSLLNLCSGTAHATYPVMPRPAPPAMVAKGTVQISITKKMMDSPMHISGDAARVLFGALDQIVNPGIVEPAIFPAEARSVSNQYARCDRNKISVVVTRAIVCDPKMGDCNLDQPAPQGKNSYSCRINIGHALGADLISIK